MSLLIDTGSSDAAVNPGLYKPTPASQNLHKNGSLRYSTTQENGCGTADVSLAYIPHLHSQRFDLPLAHTYMQIAYTEFVDTISFAGLTSKKQTFGNINPTPQPNNSTITQFPHQGLVGFAGIDSSEIGATPFFTNLCNQNAVSACRFGLALGTDNTGSQYLGELDSSQFAGALTTAPILDQWELPGDVSVAGKTITTNQTIILDSGTANVIGPISAVQDLFDAAGIQGVTQTLSGCTKVLTGYYPCASPPTVGFKFPAGADGKVFDILGSAFEEADDGAGNCTAIVAGIDFGPGIWIVGQAWFQGKYVDHDVSGKTLGFADLK